MAQPRLPLYLASGVCAYFLLGSDCGGFYPHFPDRPDARLSDAPFDAPYVRTVRPPDLDDAFVPAGTSVHRAGRWDVHVMAADTGHRDSQGLGLAAELVVEPSGTFHVVHGHGDTNEVLYTRGAPGGFRTEHVAVEAVELGSFTGASLVVADDGTVHVAYANDAELGATHAVRAPDGSWSRVRLPFAGGSTLGDQPAVARLPSGDLYFVGARPIAALPPPTAGDRELVVFDPAVGEVAIGVGEDSPLLRIEALVSGDTPHALFTWSSASAEGRAMHVATRAPSGTWSTRRLDEAGNASHAAGPDGSLHLVFTRRTPRGAWQFVHSVGPGDDSTRVEERVLADDTFVGNASIAVSSAGVAHVAYNGSHSGIFYATDADGTWRTERIEAGWWPDVALDAAGVPWIAYRDGPGRLVLATPAR